MPCRHPKSKVTIRETCYTGCIAYPPTDCNGGSHGNITELAECECGATKRTNINGRYSETSGWWRDADLEAGS